MTTSTYANARDILPVDLIIAIQKYWSGLLWIPVKQRDYQERRNLIASLSQQGICSRQIAVLSGLTTRRINQILAEKGVTDRSSKC